MRVIRVLASVVPLLFLSLQSCASKAIAEGQGRGLSAVDRSLPSGAKSFPRPAWKLGDRFTYRRGGKLRIAQSVVSADENGYVLEEALSKVRTELGLDYEQRGESAEDDPWSVKHLAPGDWRATWPLWVGKRWVCEYWVKKPGEDPLPVIAEYVCDGVETVTTPAGAFECARIWRRARPAIEGRTFLDQTSMFWYAPKVGTFVRILKDGVLTELETYQRQ